MSTSGPMPAIGPYACPDSWRLRADLQSKRVKDPVPGSLPYPYTIFSRHLSIRHGSPKGRESINLKTRHFLNQRTVPVPNPSLDPILLSVRDQRNRASGHQLA